MIRVLIVDDSPTVRMLLQSILESDPAIGVVGVAVNGEEGLRQAHALKPDLVTMDIRMPVMDGYEATRRIMQECPTPIVMVSQSVDPGEPAIAFDALQAGALSIVRTPPSPEHPEHALEREQLLTAVKLMAEVKVVRRRRSDADTTSASAPAHPVRARTRPALIVIGASTGGPAALNTLLRALPADFPLPIAVVQHMSVGFADGLTRWLQQQSALPLEVGVDNARLLGGRVYFAPDSRHLVVRARGVLGLSDAPPVSFVRPSATVLFSSAAQVYKAEVVGVLLTGMGEDGARGLLEIRSSGGATLAQDEASCVVYGMPAVAAALGAVEKVLPLERMAAALVELARPTRL